jgi:hypothetical protein
MFLPQVNKVGLQIRAAVITSVYHKTLAVKSTGLYTFSTGEVNKLNVMILCKNLHLSIFFSMLLSPHYFLYSGCEFYEHRYRSYCEFLSKFSSVLEFTISSCSLVVPSSPTSMSHFC